MLLVGAVLYQTMPLLALSFASPQRYAAETGTVREIRLSDGTRMTLAGGARIEVRYTYHDRRIELTRGAIYADVAHEERRPFRIDTPNASVVDIGTRFEVLSKEGETRVAVASGIVDFGGSGWPEKPIRLKENQAAILDGARLRRLPDINPNDVARWRSEWTEYRGVPLQQVISDLDSLSPQRIEIADEVLAKMPVSGRIRLRDPVGQLQNLAITHNFKILQSKGTLVVAAK